MIYIILDRNLRRASYLRRKSWGREGGRGGGRGCDGFVTRLWEVGDVMGFVGCGKLGVRGGLEGRIWRVGLLLFNVV